MLNAFGGKRGERQKAQGIYGQQRRELEATHAEQGLDVFVSPFDILKDDAGTELSYCTWPESLCTWLPRTDCIAFTGTRDGRRWYLIVPWDPAHAVCGNLLEKIVNVDPDRFKTMGWPTPEQLSRLEQMAIIKK